MITEKGVDKKGNRYWSMTVEPVSYPVTVDEIKEFARIDGTDEDSILESFLVGVVNSVEAYLGRALITRTYKLIMDEWNSKDIELPMPPLISVSSVKTVDESDTETTYSSSNYFVITESIPGRLVIKKDAEIPTNTERYQAGYNITFTAGYGTNRNNVPKQIRIAIMQWVTIIYENRSMAENDFNSNNKITGREIPMEVQNILKPYRVARL